MHDARLLPRTQKIIGLSRIAQPAGCFQSDSERRFIDFVFPTVHRVGATPVPIPNTEVKPHFGDGTAGITCGRVARRWDLFESGVASTFESMWRRFFFQTLRFSVWLAKAASPQSSRVFVSVPCRTTKTSGPSVYSGIRCAIQGLGEAGSNQNESCGTMALASREKKEPKSGP